MDIIMKPGDEVTGRIRWEQPVLTLYGYVAGEAGVSTFIVHCPGAGDTSGPWVLTSTLPGQREWRLSGDQPEALRKAAEAWVAEFVSSLGAVFPEDAYEFEEFDEERFRAQFAPGAYVRYQNPDAGWPGDQIKAREVLTLGGIYGIAWSEVGQSKTSIGLVGIDGTFNSVLFEPVPPHPEEETGR